MSTEFFPAGRPAPAFKQKAIGSGREVSPHAMAGRPLVLVFVNEASQRIGRGLFKAMRDQYPSVSQVWLATVVDLQGVPVILKGMAESEMKKQYEKLAGRLPPEDDPTEYVVIVPDWKGEILKAFGLKRLDQHPAAVVIDAQGVVQGSYLGETPDTTILNALAGCVSA